MNKDGKHGHRRHPAEPGGLAEIKKMMADGVAEVQTDTTPATGWGGEALGKGAAAMTIEGNWISGALTKDFPNLKYKVVELPAGPAGKGTLLFSNCWGIAAKSAAPGAGGRPGQVPHQRRPADGLRQGLRRHAVDRRRAPRQFAETVPRRRRRSWPVAPYAQGPVNLPGFDQVMAAFNSKMATLGKGGDPKAMLAELQKNGDAALKGS